MLPTGLVVHQVKRVRPRLILPHLGGLSREREMTDCLPFYLIAGRDFDMVIHPEDFSLICHDYVGSVVIRLTISLGCMRRITQQRLGRSVVIRSFFNVVPEPFQLCS
jgi:hypothetical protein